MQRYEEALEDERRLTREIDVLLNGEEGAAKQASLCDLVAQLKKHELEGGILAALSAVEAENRRLRGHVAALLKAIDERDYYNDSVFEPAREALKQ